MRGFEAPYVAIKFPFARIRAPRKTGCGYFVLDLYALKRGLVSRNETFPILHTHIVAEMFPSYHLRYSK